MEQIHVFWPTQKWSQMAPNGASRNFPTNPNLADILVDADSEFENLYFLFFRIPAWTRLGPGLGPWSQLEVPCPDAGGAAGKLSDPNLTILPTHPGIKQLY